MGQVITIAQQKGGAGKTTLAVNLAGGFARAGRTVALMDTDPQGSLSWGLTTPKLTWMCCGRPIAPGGMLLS